MYAYIEIEAKPTLNVLLLENGVKTVWFRAYSFSSRLLIFPKPIRTLLVNSNNGVSSQSNNKFGIRALIVVVPIVVKC